MSKIFKFIFPGVAAPISILVLVTGISFADKELTVGYQLVYNPW